MFVRFAAALTDFFSNTQKELDKTPIFLGK